MDQEIRDDGVEIGLARTQQQEQVTPPAIAPAAGQGNGLFAVSAPYWLNGLHNKEGMALADEINKVVLGSRLAAEKDEIEELLSSYSQARRLALSVVPERLHLDDPHRKMNLAEPISLLDGMFVRDKEGSYRPAAGGRAVVVDKGESLTLKGKNQESYEAAMALAKAKGWTAISLKGNKKTMESAWIEAKLAGIEVVNYEPTKEAQAKLAARLAEKTAGVELHQEAALPCVSSGMYSGSIVAIEGGQAVQVYGRDPEKTVRHDISKLSRLPIVGAVEDISYNRDGQGIVKDRVQQKEIAR